MVDEPDRLVLQYLRLIDAKLDRILADMRNLEMRYTVLLEREKDGGYVASVPALPGCISQGGSRPQALANIREDIALYIEDCREVGDPVPNESDKEFIEVEVA